MKKSEVAIFLGMVAGTDGRTVGDLDVQTWHAILPEEITLTDAEAALFNHRRTCSDFFTPKHVIDSIAAVRRERLTRAGTPPMPGDLTWQQEKNWRVLWCANVKDGMNPPEAALAASDAMNLPRDPAIEVRADRVRQIERFHFQDMPATDAIVARNERHAQ